ncbi:hypothetical protein EVAR_102929_1 [Eumeta japonica]|uniref:Uncharacterized protein n=1 Tax=Eumeta variegata TaxID=151549 RepID=A0A4C1ZZN9_EUMVA|nr:hypothetical protein EVAR_102929_1 [Eumeta japonica]
MPCSFAYQPVFCDRHSVYSRVYAYFVNYFFFVCHLSVGKTANANTEHKMAAAHESAYVRAFHLCCAEVSLDSPVPSVTVLKLRNIPTNGAQCAVLKFRNIPTNCAVITKKY